MTTKEKDIEVFSMWLLDNGAKWPKIQWPSVDTVGGCRGAQAIEDIETNEAMIEIPIILMMTPLSAFEDPIVGKILKENQDFLKGDNLLSVYIMHEMRKGADSFYAPFLRILPEPGLVSRWTPEQMEMLQDDNIILRAKNKSVMLSSMYERTVGLLIHRYPEQFPANEFPFEAYQFAWQSVQARAFGKRLPWTAMVPFADCLNHGNVQTKYDYNVEGNGMFRLFPTGRNRYPRGAEVINSYGRRANENLLLDYGFAMLDNEWDNVSHILQIKLLSHPLSINFQSLFCCCLNSLCFFLLFMLLN